MPSNISDAQALTILRDASNKTFDASSRAESGAIGEVLGAKTRQLRDTAAQAHAEQKDSISKFASNSFGTSLNFKASLYGNSRGDIRQMKAEADAAFRARKDDDQTRRMAVNTVAQGGGFSDAVGKAHDAWSANSGFQKDVSDAKVDQKLAETAESVANVHKDGAKANKEQAAKAVDAVNDVAKGFFERAKQVIDRAFGG